MGQDLNAVRFFVAVADAGSFRGAARALGIPKSNVSRKVAELEEQLGTRLLHRNTRRLALTDAGVAYHGHASLAIGTLQEAERAATAAQAEPQGLLRITASVNVVLLALQPILLEFMTSYPKVEVVVDLSERVVDIVAEQFDVALRAGPLLDSSLIAVRLGSASMRVFGSPAYFQKHGHPRSPSDLSAHECLRMTTRSTNIWQFIVKRKTVDVKVKGRFECNNLTMLRDAAIAGIGLTRLPEVLARDPVQAGRLVQTLETFAAPESPLHAVFPSNRFVPPKVRAFVDLLKQRIPML
jgi:DNA-binding transcriptional LysR family regulator